MEKNQFIKVWKETAELLVKTMTQELAKEQYDKIEASRPNKDRPLKDNPMTETQKEYLDYLEKVIQTGEL